VEQQSEAIREISANISQVSLGLKEINQKLVETNQATAQVAQEMFLSINTVKWYAKSIYRKLNVNRRTQAIAKAREFGLIP
jgi:DNA-binding CsgD family transcriptional regulator